ncbi:MAG TPA: GTP-binding protein, partial [Pseudomonas sp.]|nr:GTP-binding protein [Pseudomonas sp.]
MLNHIPTHLIAGPLGAGKTSLIRQLLTQKPADERWAVLINEFGQIGLDAALLSTDAQGIAMAEVPGGCLCCVNGAPFQVGLARLLRQARPDRLLIEPSGLGHPLELLRQLREPPWQGVLALQPPVLVLDAPALAAGAALPEIPETAGLLLLNKAETLDQATREALVARLPSVPLLWSSQGRMDFTQLPGHAVRAGVAAAELAVPAAPAAAGSLWLDPRVPICQAQQQAEGWSIGWRWHPTQCFELLRVQQWLAGL